MLQMYSHIFPIIFIVVSNIVYHLSQKSMPVKSNPFSLLLITYLISASISAIGMVFTKTDKHTLLLGYFNWRSLVLSIALIGIETGYLLAYRAGWNISVGSLVANILLAILLKLLIYFFLMKNLKFIKMLEHAYVL
jgi:hypothetical protein